VVGRPDCSVQGDAVTSTVPTSMDSAPTVDWEPLADVAWRTRENARPFGTTRVGAAALSAEGSTYGGCNIEHRFRSHDIHAEVGALGALVADGARELKAILIASHTERFTPCGTCPDWIFELGGKGCIVFIQRAEVDAPTRVPSRKSSCLTTPDSTLPPIRGAALTKRAFFCGR
jgi:cytidine deaminase